jgi:hypothetical protein
MFDSRTGGGGLADALERFLCPGGKLRLSPYVEAAQCLVLFGEQPDPRRHGASVREIVGRPGHAGKLRAVAQAFLGDTDGSRFGSYAEQEHLDLCLAHYFPANVGKVQTVLLDLLRAGHFPEELHLVDLGVGTGTSFVAVLDFVLALGAVADLAGAALPLRALGLCGYDRSPACLAYTDRVAGAFGRALAAYGEGARPAGTGGPAGGGSGEALASARVLVDKALAGARLRQADLCDGGAVECPRPCFVVLSYVLGHICDQQEVEERPGRLPLLGPGSQLAVLEPGDPGSATRLMRWRRLLLRRHPGLVPLLPCGQEFGRQLPAACDTCWCARREEIHAAPLQAAYFRGLREASQNLGPEEQYRIQRGGKRLSWSYFVLAAPPRPGQGTAPVPPGAEVHRYIGRRREGPDGARSVAGEAAEAPATEERRLVALCPARAEAAGHPCRSAVLVQDPGKALPALRFGDLVTLENVTWREEGADAVGTMNRDSRVRPVGAAGAAAIGPPSDAARRASLDALARRLFGFPALRDFQHTVIRRAL